MKRLEPKRPRAQLLKPKTALPEAGFQWPRPPGKPVWPGRGLFPPPPLLPSSSPPRPPRARRSDGRGRCGMRRRPGDQRDTPPLREPIAARRGRAETGVRRTAGQCSRAVRRWVGPHSHWGWQPLTARAGGRVSEGGPEAASKRVCSGMLQAAGPEGGGFRDSIYPGCLSTCGA